METRQKQQARTYLGEFFATFIFFFAVCSTSLNAPIINIPTIGPIAAGFAAFAVVFCFGGHFNPAVTVGAMMGRKMDTKTGLIYIAVQLVASFMAIGTTVLLFPGTTNSDYLMLQPGVLSATVSAFFMEFLLTFILVFVIFRTAMGVVVRPRISVPADDPEASVETVKEFQGRVKAAEARKHHGALVIGLTIGFLATMGGRVSGGAFNPLRPTAPAFFTLNFNYLWIYWVADLAGGAAAGALHYYVFEDNDAK